MATEILHPQDWLIQRFGFVPTVSPHHKPSSYDHHPEPSRKQAPKRAFHFEQFTKKTSAPKTIVKRGESLDPPKRREFQGRDRRKATVSFDDRDLIVSDINVYAGSAFSQSPPPSSLPLPSFSKKKESLPGFDDSATRDLRRLLRID
ncbi:uncharacterized protein LOC131231075 [Magnolia sinica]|uniref:uncharacterized protein LOC131231075 n=1 Tax=Magnolia sinica TaxID=86752 RepID=UPI0026580D6B|nr:uncharacterized protein LOC131231075 [Magnolia sinica]